MCLMCIYNTYLYIDPSIYSPPGLPGWLVEPRPPHLPPTPLANAEDIRDAALTLAQKDPLEESRILACRIPWTEEPGRPQSIGLHKVGHD